jgi:hypothetical protein
VATVKTITQTGHFNRIKVVNDGKPVLGLSLGDYRRSYLLQRPVVHPLYSPAGLPLTEQGAHNCPHHRGVWVGHATVNGMNFFHEGPDTGWVVPTGVDVRETADDVVIDLKTEWRDPRGSVMATETRRYSVRLAGEGYVLDVLSNLSPTTVPLVMAPNMHAYMGVRVIDALDEDDGGHILNSEGSVGEEAVSWEKSKQKVAWVDYSGQMGGLAAGVSMIAHPSQSPIAVYARVYGSLFLNPTPVPDGSVEIPVGTTFKFGARFYAHDGEPSAERINALWRNFGEVGLEI